MTTNMTDVQIGKIVTCEISKSSKIRYLTSKQYTRTQIAKILNIRYQHVKNVQDQNLKELDLNAEIEEIDKILDVQDTNQLDLFR